MQGYSRGSGGCLPAQWALPADAGRPWWCCSWRSGSRRAGAGLGRRRLLLVRPDLRHSPHQPVLDAGQHHLRPAPGEAALRVHRRRRQPRGRRRRRHHSLLGEDDRQRQPDAGERGVLALCAVIVSLIVRASGARTRTSLAWSRPARKRASAAARRSRCCATAGTCRSSRSMIAMTAIGAGLIDQQLSMATEAAKGAGTPTR